jgi:hypothetical protein
LWNKLYTWFCIEDNQVRYGYFKSNDQSERAYLNENESLEIRQQETNPVGCLIVMYKSKFLKFILQFVTYQLQQQRNEEAEDVIIAVI